MSQNQVDADENDSIEKEDLVIDELEDSLSRSDSSESGQQPVLNRAFYAIDATAPEGTKSMSAKSNSTTTNVDEQKPTLEAAISSTASSQINASSTRNYNATKGVTDASKTDKKDENLTNVFFQSDE